MKSKEDVLQNEAVKLYGKTVYEGNEIRYVAFSEKVVHAAMDEYAKETVIEFSKWCNEKENGFWEAYKDAKNWEELEPNTLQKVQFDHLSIEKKFNQFIQSLNNDTSK